jgi:hypothetical protein
MKHSPQRWGRAWDHRAWDHRACGGGRGTGRGDQRGSRGRNRSADAPPNPTGSDQNGRGPFALDPLIGMDNPDRPLRSRLLQVPNCVASTCSMSHRSRVKIWIGTISDPLCQKSVLASNLWFKSIHGSFLLGRIFSRRRRMPPMNEVEAPAKHGLENLRR